MVIGFDEINPTILVGTTEQQINDGNPVTTPNDAQQIVEVVPSLVALGIVTVEEGIMPIMRIQSDDVAVEPKIFNFEGMNGPLLSGPIQSPIFEAKPMNIRIAEQSRINFFANNQVDASVEPAVGGYVVYSDQGANMPEQFYQKPTNESAISTTLDGRASGNDITITGGAEINMLSSLLSIGLGDVVESEHLAGTAEWSSSDFQTSFPYRIAAQSVNYGSGPTTSTQSDGYKMTRMPIGQGIPIAGRTVINTFFTSRTNIASVSEFILGVGYIK